MDFSAKDCIWARVQLCKQLISFAKVIKENIFQFTLDQYKEKVNIIKKTLFICKRSHAQYFGDRSPIRADFCLFLKQIFFNSHFLMTLKGQPNVKSQYDPHFDYFRRSDADAIEQFSRDPQDAFDFFQEGTSNKSSRDSWTFSASSPFDAPKTSHSPSSSTN